MYFKVPIVTILHAFTQIIISFFQILHFQVFLISLNDLSHGYQRPGQRFEIILW